MYCYTFPGPPTFFSDTTKAISLSTVVQFANQGVRLMRKFSVIAAALSVAAIALPAAANAQTSQSINQRQANLSARIDQGVRSGALNRNEAYRLRTQFRALARLEANYRRSRPGLTLAERRDLDRRLDVLSNRIQVQKRDRQYR